MFLVQIIQALLLGIVEGITEWLPISSTGHMMLFEHFWKLNVSKEFNEMFLVVIQLGAILAVVVIFWKQLIPFSIKPKLALKNSTISLWLKIFAACLPAAVIGFLFDDKIDEYFFNIPTVVTTLLLYGILMIFIENKKHLPKFNSLDTLTYKTAIIIGLFQLLALIPGTSRSGATIIGAMLIGCSRTIAAEFTFFLAIPVMFGASLLKLAKFGLHYTSEEIILLLAGMLTAFIVSLIAIKFLMGYVKKHDFKLFGWYRIILGLVLALSLIIK